MSSFSILTNHNVISLQSFTLFTEYFISVSILFILIVTVLITYSVYGLMLQKAVCECLAFILLMSCILLLNDDLVNFNFLSFNESIINDSLSFFAKFLICLASSIYFFLISNYLKPQKLTSIEYLLILAFSILGLILLCSSNDLLTAYLAIELSSLSFYLLASCKKTSTYSVEAGLKYFITGAVSSSFFLLGSSFLYGITGSVNFAIFSSLFHSTFFFNPGADFTSLLNIKLALFGNSFLEIGLLLILFSLFIKLALAPFHLWSLDVYEGSPTTTSFFFAAISKFSIFILLIRLCYVCFFDFSNYWQFYLLFIGAFSIFVGSLGGLKERKLKTLLAYSSTSHMGYLLFVFSGGACLIDNFLNLRVLFFYLIIYCIVSICMWSIIVLLNLKTNKINFKLNKELGDLVILNKSNPALAVSIAFIMFSMAGIPPLIGFLAKLTIFSTIIYNITFTYLIILISIVISVFSTFYYIRIIKILYTENNPSGKLYYPINNNKLIILSFLLFLLIFFFINPNLLDLIIYDVTLDCYNSCFDTTYIKNYYNKPVLNLTSENLKIIKQAEIIADSTENLKIIKQVEIIADSIENLKIIKQAEIIADSICNEKFKILIDKINARSSW